MEKFDNDSLLFVCHGNFLIMYLYGYHFLKLSLHFCYVKTYDWEPTKANNLLTLFWIVYGVGRAVGIPTTKFIKPWIYIVIDCVGSLVGISMLIGFDYSFGDGMGEDGPLIAATCIFAFFVACVYGCATNLTNEFTNMSLTYVFLSQLGNSIGAMSLPTVTGNLVSEDPVWMGWMVLIVCVSCLLFEALIFVTGRRVQAKFAPLHEDPSSETLEKGIQNENFDAIEEKNNDENTDL